MTEQEYFEQFGGEEDPHGGYVRGKDAVIKYPLGFPLLGATPDGEVKLRATKLTPIELRFDEGAAKG